MSGTLTNTNEVDLVVDQEASRDGNTRDRRMGIDIIIKEKDVKVAAMAAYVSWRNPNILEVCHKGVKCFENVLKCCVGAIKNEPETILVKSSVFRNEKTVDSGQSMGVQGKNAHPKTVRNCNNILKGFEGIDAVFVHLDCLFVSQNEQGIKIDTKGMKNGLWGVYGSRC